MPQIYEYTFFSNQKTALPEPLRQAVNMTLTDMRGGRFNNLKTIQGKRGQNVLKEKVKMPAADRLAYKIQETRVDGHWRLFFFTNPSANLTVICMGHMDEGDMLVLP